MFEKEAEEYAKESYDFLANRGAVENIWQDGAEFGYNKAKDDSDKMKSRFLELCNLKDMRIKELEKANEWHYMKDGKYPTHSNRVLVFTDEGVGFGIYGLDDKKGQGMIEKVKNLVDFFILLVLSVILFILWRFRK